MGEQGGRIRVEIHPNRVDYKEVSRKMIMVIQSRLHSWPILKTLDARERLFISLMFRWKVWATLAPNSNVPKFPREFFLLIPSASRGHLKSSPWIVSSFQKDETKKTSWGRDLFSFKCGRRKTLSSKFWEIH